MTKLNQVGQFAVGIFISLVLSAVAVPLGFVVAFFLFFLGPSEPIGPAAAILLPAVLAITFWRAKGNRARMLGAAVFFPCAAVALYAGYTLTTGREVAAERAAAQLDFSSRTIAQPLGTIDVLGIPLDPTEAARLRQLAAQVCPAQGRRLVPRQCFERYNQVVGVIFTPEAAADLRWPM
jgi:hypothetical protein